MSPGQQICLLHKLQNVQKKLLYQTFIFHYLFVAIKLRERKKAQQEEAAAGSDDAGNAGDAGNDGDVKDEGDTGDEGDVGDAGDVRDVLESMDTTGEGVITLDKLRQMAKELNLDFTEEEMQDMINEADPSGKGQVDFKKIDNLFEETKVAMEAEDKMTVDIDEAFKLFDTGQSGRMRTKQLAKALRIANMYPTKQDVRDILRKLGYPKTITHKQFTRIIEEVSKTDNERLVAAFQCYDKENTGSLSEDKLRQILVPAICAEFTETDLEQIICEFCVDGQVDLEVLVAYISGQEQYLSNTKKPTEEESPEELQTLPEEPQEMPETAEPAEQSL